MWQYNIYAVPSRLSVRNRRRKSRTQPMYERPSSVGAYDNNIRHPDLRRHYDSPRNYYSHTTDNRSGRAFDSQTAPRTWPLRGVQGRRRSRSRGVSHRQIGGAWSKNLMRKIPARCSSICSRIRVPKRTTPYTCSVSRGFPAADILRFIYNILIREYRIIMYTLQFIPR